MKLLPGIGIDKVKFGIRELELIALLGKPDLVIVDPEDEDENPVYQYNELYSRFTFYNDAEGKLGYMRCSSPLLDLDGCSIIDSELEKVKKMLPIAMDRWNKEKYFTFNAFFNEELWLTLHEEYGRVTGIELGVGFNEDDSYRWPKDEYSGST